MHLTLTIALSIIGGFLVNLTVDTLPNRVSVQQAYGAQWRALRCALQRSAAESCEGVFSRRTVVTYLAAILFGLLAYIRYGFTIETGIVAVYALYLLAIAIVDLEHRKVLNRMLVWAMPVVAAVILIVGMPPISSAVMGAAIGLGVFILAAIVKPGGMGMGDVKLAALIGLATGVSGVAIALTVGVISGGLVGFVLLVHTKNRKTTMAYAPYLAFGAWIALYFGAEIINLYVA